MLTLGWPCRWVVEARRRLLQVLTHILDRLWCRSTTIAMTQDNSICYVIVCYAVMNIDIDFNVWCFMFSEAVSSLFSYRKWLWLVNVSSRMPPHKLKSNLHLLNFFCISCVQITSFWCTDRYIYIIYILRILTHSSAVLFHAFHFNLFIVLCLGEFGLF